MEVVSLFPLVVRLLPLLILALMMYLAIVFPVVWLASIRSSSNGKKKKSLSTSESE